jgi:hypothetical protein
MPIPKWFRPLAVVALIWNLLGCAAYLADVTLTAEDVARMTPAQQELYAARPKWAVAATATAVWAGAAEFMQSVPNGRQRPRVRGRGLRNARSRRGSSEGPYMATNGARRRRACPRSS